MPFDPRCTEWLVEIPHRSELGEHTLAADAVRFKQLLPPWPSSTFYMQCQTTTNGPQHSATVEFRENEIEPLAEAILKRSMRKGPISQQPCWPAFDATPPSPRLPLDHRSGHLQPP